MVLVVLVILLIDLDLVNLRRLPNSSIMRHIIKESSTGGFLKINKKQQHNSMNLVIHSTGSFSCYRIYCILKYLVLVYSCSLQLRV